MTERWVELDEFPDYAISNYANITNMKSGVPRKPSINRQGILKITLFDADGVSATRSLAVLVATAFVERQEDHYDTVIHRDGDRSNCVADNLLWRPRWHAIMFHKQFMHEALYNDKAPRVELKTGAEHESMLEVVKTHGVHYKDVFSSCINGTPVFPGGLRFKLVE